MRVLSVSYGGGHAQIAACVGQELTRRGHSVDYLGLTTGYGALRRQGIESFGFRDLVLPSDHDALELGRKLAGQLADHPDVHPDESIPYLGLSMSDLIAQHGLDRAEQLFREQGRQCLLPIQALERAVDRVKPDLILATNSPRAEHAAIEVARRRGIPSVCVVDLLLGFDLPRLRTPGYGTQVCVITEGVRQKLISEGRHPDEIVVTGNPAFDELASPTRESDALAWREKNGWTDKKLILWVSQPEPGNDRFGFDHAMQIYEHVRRHPDWKLIVRPHPNERFPLSELPDDVFLSTQAEPIPMLLTAVDVPVVIASTMGMQAVLMGKSLCVLDVPALSEPVPYVEMGFGLSATPETCGEALEHIINGDVPEPTGLPAVGQGTENVVAVIERLKT